MQQASSLIPTNNVIDNYVLERIHYRARRFALQFGLSDEQREDCAQDMIVAVLNASNTYDPSKSDRKTFISRVLDNFIRNAMRAEFCRRQRECQCPASIDDLSDSSIPTVNERDGGLTETEKSDLKIDLAVILSKMPRDLKRICMLLTTHSISEIARKLDINRTVIYRQIAEIRTYFTEAGYESSVFCATDMA